MARNYYEILGVSKNASQDEIKTAYRKLAHQYHPDKAGGDIEKMKEVNEAYQILKDKDKRARYDQFGSAGTSGAGFGGGGFNAEDFSDFFRRQQSQSGGGFGFDFSDFEVGDIFGDFFGGTRRTKKEEPTSRMQFEISVKDAEKGIQQKIRIKETCDHCKGSGSEPGTSKKKCPTCKGTGSVKQVKRTLFGNFMMQAPCPTCGGSGEIIEKKCKKCGGIGVIESIKTINISIK